MSFAVSATDADGAPVPMLGADLSELPGSPSFVDNTDGTGSFSWVPAGGDAPGPYSVTFTATDAVDGALTSVEVISIDVQAATSGGRSRGGSGGGGVAPIFVAILMLVTASKRRRVDIERKNGG